MLGIAVNLTPFIPAGFGLGALNDADEDDIDIYESRSAHPGRSRVAFDSAIGDDDHHISIGSSSLQKRDARQRPVGAFCLVATLRHSDVVG